MRTEEEVHVEWRLALVSGTKALARHLQINDVDSIHPSYGDFRWASRNTIGENPWMRYARGMLMVAEQQLADYDEARKQS